MALKRYIPVQDTFIVSGSDYNYGADEILELGCTEYGKGPARILLQFPVEEAKKILETEDYRAILHLNISEAKNLPGQIGLIVSTIPQEWQEGIGRAGDLNTCGATWELTGRLDIQEVPERWDEPGVVSVRIFDGKYANQVNIRYRIDGGSGEAPTITRTVISGGGAQGWGTLNSEGVLQTCKQGIYRSNGLLSDLELDITEIVRAWEVSSNTGLLLKFENEQECLLFGSQISFYSKDTHTIYRPYLEIKWDDSEYTTGSLLESADLYGTFANNLRESYTEDDIARVNLTIKNPYASRVWSTGSIYQPSCILPETSYWGIKDEYTNEMIIDFDPTATRISADDSGSFFILDTSNLEPERYYRLLVQVEKDNQKIIVDNKNIFRVGRNGKHQG